MRFAIGGAVFLALFHAVLLTLDDVGMTIDEPIHLELEARQRTWWKEFVRAESGQRRWALLSHESLEEHFRHEDHPILGRHLANVSFLVLRPVTAALFGPLGIEIDRWAASRLATAMLFGAVGVVVFLAVGARFGLTAGLAGAAALALMPRVFGHAHLDTLDFQVSAWWFFSFCAFFRALRSWPATLGFALLVGLAWATQFSGILVLVPLVVWALVHRELRAVRPLLAALVLAPLVLVLLLPHWWHDPIGRPPTKEQAGVGLRDFVHRSTHRRDYMSHHCYYLGRRYVFSLPWHNALVLSAVTVPTGLLGLGLLGLGRGAWSLGVGLRHRHRPCSFTAGLAIVFSFWMVLRALPSSPDHDGLRLFLHAFVFLAALIGIGVSEVLSWARQPLPDAPNRLHRLRATAGRYHLGHALCGIAMVSAAAELWWIHPYPLSYYNRLAGHPAGGLALGMESTYWADAITPEVVGWLNAKAPTTVFAFWTPTLDALSSVGRIGPEVRVAGQQPGTLPEWILLFSRQSNWDPAEEAGRYVQVARRIVSEVKPVKIWSTRDGVPLVRAYRRDAIAARLAQPDRASSP